jgi:tetratricopeptide (TPR) repeat protein
MLSDADMVAASQPETRWLPTFSLVYSWVLLNKSARTPDEAREALRHAKDAVNASEQEYLLAFAHNNLALAYLANRDSQGDTERMRLAIEHQQLAIDKMPEHHLFLRAELDQTMASLLEAAQRVSEARKFLEQAVNWRIEVVPAKNIHIADARMRLAEHLIKHGDGAGDLESAEEQLLEEINQTVIEARPPNDVSRTRWVSLLIDLYDTWGKPVEREKWEQTRSNVMD